MTTYRPGGHWSRQTLVEVGTQPADEEGRRPDDKLLAMFDSSAPQWLVAWICTLLNANICDCGHEGLDEMFHLHPCPLRKAPRP
jgi:hypothetical protein